MSELRVGDKIAPFTLPDQDGNTFRSEDALAKGPLVVFFYPKDDSPGCTVEACSFRDASGDFMEAGATVVGVSSDSVESHRRFASKHNLPYSLLADEGGVLRKQFGVPKAMLGLLEGRVTYVIDPGGVLRHKFDAMVRVNKHVEEALSIVRSIKSAS